MKRLIFILLLAGITQCQGKGKRPFLLADETTYVPAAMGYDFKIISCNDSTASQIRKGLNGKFHRYTAEWKKDHWHYSFYFRGNARPSVDSFLVVKQWERLPTPDQGMRLF
jgi:hypothetical protein